MMQFLVVVLMMAVSDAEIVSAKKLKEDYMGLRVETDAAIISMGKDAGGVYVNATA